MILRLKSAVLRLGGLTQKAYLQNFEWFHKKPRMRWKCHTMTHQIFINKHYDFMCDIRLVLAFSWDIRIFSSFGSKSENLAAEVRHPSLQVCTHSALQWIVPISNCCAYFKIYLINFILIKRQLANFISQSISATEQYIHKK